MSEDMKLKDAIAVVLIMADSTAAKAESLEDSGLAVAAEEYRRDETALRLVAQAASPTVPVEVELEVRRLIKQHRRSAARFAAEGTDTRHEVVQMYLEFAEEENDSAEALATLLRIVGVNPDE